MSKELRTRLRELAGDVRDFCDSMNNEDGYFTPEDADTIRAAEAEIGRLAQDIATAREECPAVRMQDYADAPLLTLVREEISQLFRMQARAEAAEASRDEWRTLAQEWRPIVEKVQAMEQAAERARVAWLHAKSTSLPPDVVVNTEEAALIDAALAAAPPASGEEPK